MTGSAGVAPWIAMSVSTKACESAVKCAGVRSAGGVPPRSTRPATCVIT